MRILVLIGLCASGAASAQTTPPASETGWWGGLGGGFARELDGGSGLLGFAVRVQTPYEVGPARVGAGGSAALSLGGFALGEVHVTAGTDVSTGPILVALAAGPSLASVEGGAGGVLGLHAEAQVLLVVLPRLGVGVEAYANVNREAAVVGFGTSLAFGRLPARAAIPDPPPRPRPAR